MKKNKKLLMIAILLLLIVLVGTWAFSKYTTTLTGTGTASVAKWSFKVNGSATETITDLDLLDTTLNSKVVDGKIAPGTDGSFAVEIDASGSEVAVKYTIELSGLTGMPTNLKFYTDSTFTTEMEITDGKCSTTETIALGDVDTPVIKTIYWQWAYETTEIADNDLIDTTDSALEDTTFTVKVVGVQQDPRVAN